MRSGTIAFAVGILFFQQLPALPPAAWAAALPLLGWLALYPPRGPLRGIVRLGAWAGAGFLWTLLAAHSAVPHPLPPKLEGRNLTLTGHIATLPSVHAHSVRFEFDVERLSYKDRSYDGPGRVRLSWYGRAPRLRAGEPWRLTVRLKRPHGFMNPGGFDYEGWLFRRGIGATGYVRAHVENERLGPPSASYVVQSVRQWLRGRIRAALPRGRERAVIVALTLGERGELDNADWEVLRRTGTSHLLAISGLHIGLIAGLVWLLAARLWARSARAALWLPAPKAGALAGLAAALLYSLLAGFSLPTQRALIMLAVVAVAVLSQRAVTPSRTLILALLAVLVFDPLAVMAPGLWLSYAAVAAILYGMTGRLRRGPRWYQWGRVQWVVTLGLLPVLLWQFQQASLVSPLANLAAVPLVSLVIVPLSLTGLALAALGTPFGVGLGTPLLKLTAWLVGGLWTALGWLGALPAAQWTAPVGPAGTLLAVLALAAVGVALLLGPRGLPGRWLGLVLLAPLVLARAPRPGPGEAWFTLLDVGQGLSAVVQTHRHVLVFDTGARFSARFDAGEAVVVPFLRHAGWHRLDMLIVSHGDNDHIGGARSLLRAVPAGRVLSSVPARLNWAASGLQRGVEACRRGQHWRWDGVDFRILNPLVPRPGAGNNGSCVLRISAGGHRVLLSADIERPAERRLLSQAGGRGGVGRAGDLAADVLVAPHHGSKTSSSPAFVRAVHPSYVLFPVGYRNRYHFPNARVVERYRAIGARRLDSAAGGAIGFRLGSGSAHGLAGPFVYRREHRRYWHSP
ncbi:MAG TPA: DNA internalization-related competence protein ComEC/Rec2 [Gammaproteobacteria bacterium]|nr:DNA internalization-related competence protein ComEC/Rec2 [Gammaproteobacteria bacterium]